MNKKSVLDKHLKSKNHNKDVDLEEKVSLNFEVFLKLKENLAD